jgi:WD40 repeat protein
MSPRRGLTLLLFCSVLVCTPARSEPAESEKKPPRTDALGDPLPPGAVRRLGSARWQQEGEMISVGLSPDGKTLAAISGRDNPREVRAWDVATGKELWRKGLGGMTWSDRLAFSPAGKVLAVSDRETVTVRDTRTGEVLRRLEADSHYQGIAALAFAPDGKLLATASVMAETKDSCEVRLWDWAGGHELRRLRGHETPMYALAFSADGRRLLSSAGDAVAVWETVTGKRLRDLPAHPHLTFSPDGRLFAYPDGPSLHVEDIKGAKLFQIVGEELGWAFSPDGKRLATRGEDRTLRVWDTATGKELQTFAAPGAGSPAGFSADGKLLAAHDGGRLRLWDLAKGEEVRPFGGHRAAVTCLAASPDGRTLLTGGEDCTARVWEADTGKERAVVPFPEEAVKAVAFAPDGRTAAAAGHDGSVRLFDVATGKELHRFAGPKGTANSPEERRFLAFSADGRTLTTCDAAGMDVVWDVTAKKELRRGKKHEGERTIGLSTDGAVAVSVTVLPEMVPPGTRSLLRLRQTATGRETDLLQGGPNEEFFVASFSPDGKLLAVTRRFASSRLPRGKRSSRCKPSTSRWRWRLRPMEAAWPPSPGAARWSVPTSGSWRGGRKSVASRAPSGARGRWHGY